MSTALEYGPLRRSLEDGCKLKELAATNAYSAGSDYLHERVKQIVDAWTEAEGAHRYEAFDEDEFRTLMNAFGISEEQLTIKITLLLDDAWHVRTGGYRNKFPQPPQLNKSRFGSSIYFPIALTAATL